jgi:hypothetical protein
VFSARPASEKAGAVYPAVLDLLDPGFDDRRVVISQRIWNSIIDRLEAWLAAHGDRTEAQVERR